MQWVPWICELYQKIWTVPEKNMNCTGKNFFWYNSYFFLVQFIFCTVHIFWYNWQIQGTHYMPFSRDLEKNAHKKGHFYIIQSNLFLFLKPTFLKRNYIYNKNIMNLTILPKNASFRYRQIIFSPNFCQNKPLCT